MTEEKVELMITLLMSIHKINLAEIELLIPNNILLENYPMIHLQILLTKGDFDVVLDHAAKIHQKKAIF